ncbi:UvsY [Sinorhizobium phage phiM7]|uniref:UvsY n=2 Tax=Emdodecavirus TaxID=1980937 RepID=A0A0F6YNI5_9CAUD|nr:putative repair and recombination protein [Sinorhizobium phage phiM12]YP_009601164.1 UvsY [Sinorhizobium phage phiM7]AGR47685.1 putative repair and recombination protein [Sinorhizobium phage phiM12]AKF12587.1 UvsY [Sinorhizobium phage phiM7]AKF12947.1 UvsY [Sinorhizobium phage phiM19]
MTVEEIHELWNVDGNIDMTNISRESANIPFLHNKYFTKYTNEYLKLKKYRADYKKLLRLKEDYFKGMLDPEELKQLGWKPCALKIRPTEISKYVDTDDDVINLSLKIGYQESIVEFLESIIKMINNRGFQLKTIVDYEKFKSGMN